MVKKIVHVARRRSVTANLLACQPQPRPQHRATGSLLRVAWPYEIGRFYERLANRTAVVRTRTPGGVTGTAREGLPMSIFDTRRPYAVRAAGTGAPAKSRFVVTS